MLGIGIAGSGGIQSGMDRLTPNGRSGIGGIGIAGMLGSGIAGSGGSHVGSVRLTPNGSSGKGGTGMAGMAGSGTEGNGGSQGGASGNVHLLAITAPRPRRRRSIGLYRRRLGERRQRPLRLLGAQHPQLCLGS